VLLFVVTLMPFLTRMSGLIYLSVALVLNAFFLYYALALKITARRAAHAGLQVLRNVSDVAVRSAAGDHYLPTTQAEVPRASVRFELDRIQHAVDEVRSAGNFRAVRMSRLPESGADPVSRSIRPACHDGFGNGRPPGRRTHLESIPTLSCDIDQLGSAAQSVRQTG